jgi:hypothetical protein
VLDGLPEKVKAGVLNDHSFQILADEDVLDQCKLRYDFDNPVSTLVYFNTKLLLESEHRIIYQIAKLIAQHVSLKDGTAASENEINAKLVDWGFKKEVDAVRYDKAMAESAGYKAGYNWAKTQNGDYLMQHFGLYFDQWNEKGLECLSKEAFDMPSNLSEADIVSDDRVKLYEIESDDHGRDRELRPVSLRGAMLAGIMTAVKELKMRELYEAKNCIDRHAGHTDVT